MNYGASPSDQRPNPWAELSDTQRRILLTLLQHGRLSRPQIMEQIGISPGSVTRLTAPLLKSGLLVSETEQVASTGRPQSPLSIRNELETTLGVILSVNLLTVVATDLRLSTCTSTQLELGEHTPAAIVKTLHNAVDQVCAELNSQGLPFPSCLGLTLGGASSDGRTVDEATFFGWSRVPLAQLVEDTLGIPCIIGNDLVGLSLSEAWFGAGIEHTRFSIVTAGSGVGFSQVNDGQVVSDRSTALGLAGVIPIPDGGHPASARPAMETLTSNAIARVWREKTGNTDTAHRVVDLARQGDPVAVEVLESFARKLGRFIGMAAAFTTPEVVVVAGERSDAAALFEDQVMAGIASVRRAGASPVPLLIRDHQRTDWARGAATLALQQRIMHS